MNFFRENKPARKGILITVVTLFFLGALVNNNGQSRISQSIGKRKLDIGLIQAQFEATVNENPSVDHHQLQAYLVQKESEKLKLYNHLEAIGLTPSTQALKSALATELPKNISIADLAKQHRQTPDELLLAISDNTAFNQLLTAINDSAIITPEMNDLHQQVVGQKRHFSDINLSNITLDADTETLMTIYEQQKHLLMSPRTYEYNYVEVSPQSLHLSKPTSQETDEHFNKHIDKYTDYNIHYTLSPQSSKAQPQEKRTRLSEAGELKAHLANLAAGESTIINKKQKQLKITLNESNATNTLSPDMHEQLTNDTLQSIHNNTVSQSLKPIAEYAYTHPDSLRDLAKMYALDVKSTSTHNPSADILSALNDEDVRSHHYISEPIKINESTYILIQLTSISEPKPLDYSDVKDKVASIYKDQVQCPKTINILRASSDITETVKHLGLEVTPLTHNLYDTATSGTLSAIIPKRSKPSPDTVLYGPTGQRWIKLNHISFDSDIPHIPDAIEGLDAEATISQLKDNA